MGAIFLALFQTTGKPSPAEGVTSLRRALGWAGRPRDDPAIWIDNGVTDLFALRVIFIEDPVKDAVVFRQTGLLLEAPGGIIFIYALELKLAVRSEKNAAREFSILAHLVNDFVARFSIGLRRGSDRLVFHVVELINRSRAIGIERNGHANGVV